MNSWPRNKVLWHPAAPKSAPCMKNMRQASSSSRFGETTSSQNSVEPLRLESSGPSMLNLLKMKHRTSTRMCFYQPWLTQPWLILPLHGWVSSSMLTFLTTTVGCFSVVVGSPVPNKHSIVMYSLYCQLGSSYPFWKRKANHIWNILKPSLPSCSQYSASVLYNDSFWMIPNAGSSLYTSPILLVYPCFLMDEPVLSTTGLQALAHDPLGGENLRKMGIETAITIIAITCYNCIVLSSYLLIFCSY